MVKKNFIGVVTPCVAAALFMSGIMFTGCSKDDDFEDWDEETVQTLAEQRMTRSPEGTQDTAKPYASGSTSTTTNDGKFSVSISWTQGYTTRYPKASLTVTATPNGNFKCENIRPEASWLGGTGIHGHVSYKVEKIEQTENGPVVKWVYRSSGFDATADLIEISDEEWESMNH